MYHFRYSPYDSRKHDVFHPPQSVLRQMSEVRASREQHGRPRRRGRKTKIYDGRRVISLCDLRSSRPARPSITPQAVQPRDPNNGQELPAEHEQAAQGQQQVLKNPIPALPTFPAFPIRIKAGAVPIKGGNRPITPVPDDARAEQCTSEGRERAVEGCASAFGGLGDDSLPEDQPISNPVSPGKVTGDTAPEEVDTPTEQSEPRPMWSFNNR